MRVYGLTGGIASGKSTVNQMFRALGVPVLDADLIAREVVEPGTPGLAAVAARFPGVLGPDGRLNRPALGERVFADAGERQALNALLHPLIAAKAQVRTAQLADEGHPFILYDAALLIENRLHERLDGVILVAAPPAVQVARIVTRDKLTPDAARARLASQLSLEEKKTHATWVVDNAGDLADTQRQVHAIWEALAARGG